MLHSQILRRRSWASLAWLLIVAIGGLATILYGYVGVLLFALIIAVSIILLVAQTPSPRRFTVHRPTALTARRAITTADGDTRAGLVVPVSTDEQYQMVLTSEGYAMVNDDGRVVYSLKS